MSDPKNRALLARTGNYEHALAVRQEESQTLEIEAVRLEQDLMSGLIEAYEFQEKLLRFSSSHSPRLTRFLEKIVWPAVDQHHFRWYTLNHDLLLERKLESRRGVFTPGVRTTRFHGANFGKHTSFDPERDIEPETDREQLIPYIKLHGSINWVNPDNDLPVIVAGRDKPHQIVSKPGSAGQLLSNYWTSFDQYVSSGCTVLVIGYSFGDVHVNEILAKPGVRVVSVDPAGYPTIKGDDKVRNGLSQNIIAVVQRTFADLVGRGNSPTEPHNAYLDDLSEILFG